MRPCQRTCAPASPSTRPIAMGTRSFANTTPTMLSCVPSYTGTRECSLWRTDSIASTEDVIESVRHSEQHVALGDAQVGLERPRRGDEGVQTPVEPGQQPQ